MEKEFSKRGGAQIGWARASWPFAKITANESLLTLKVLFFGTYTFGKGDVLRIESLKLGPLPSLTIRIFHNNPDYPERILFSSFYGPQKILHGIENTGFYRQGSPKTVIKRREETRGFPLKTFPLVALVVLWNLLFLYELNKLSGDSVASIMATPGVIAAIAIFFIVSILIRISTSISSIFLKDGRDISEIKHSLNIISLATGMMLLIIFTKHSPFS